MDNAAPYSPAVAQALQGLNRTTDQPQQAAPYHPVVKDALDQINTPENVRSAKSLLGSQDYNAYCQKFVEAVTDKKTGEYPSAIDAWNAQQAKATPGLAGIKKGDLLYFNADASNGGEGHVGLYSGLGDDGQPRFISATYDGVAEKSLPDWVQTTGQQILGYVRPSGKGRN